MLSKLQDKVIVERDVWMTMRDGTKISANIYRPDAPGKFPAIHAADFCQKDLDRIGKKRRPRRRRWAPGNEC